MLKHPAQYPELLLARWAGLLPLLNLILEDVLFNTMIKVIDLYCDPATDDRLRGLLENVPLYEDCL